MKLIDGKKTAADIRSEIKEEVSILKTKHNKTPHLAAVLVGNNGASLTYVNSKVKACQEVGFDSTLVKLDEKITEEELLIEIDKLNQNDELNGYIVQLPLPKHIDEQKVLLAVDPNKDVDGFHPTNFGRMALELESFIPATPFGILELLDRYKVETSGKDIVVIGRSHIVGRPISILLSQKGKVGNGTVSLTHSRTKNIEEYTKKADIIVTALGIPGFLKEEMVKEGVVVIDVGITRVEDASRPRGYRIAGDVEFDAVSKKASLITPVPGGVGPMTIAMLLKNTLIAFKRSNP